MTGVGPWSGPLPDDERYDPELLRDGDRRNVVDRYRYWKVEAIVADLDRSRAPLHIAIENWEHDLNIGSIVRTANAFNVAGFHIVGERRWNRRGAMVTNRYLHEFHHPDVGSLHTWADDNGLVLVGIDNVDGSVPIEGVRLPSPALMVFGQERDGLSPDARAACLESAGIYHISQYGSTRSINAAAAAAIAMHTWSTQHR